MVAGVLVIGVVMVVVVTINIRRVPRVSEAVAKMLRQKSRHGRVMLEPIFLKSVCCNFLPPTVTWGKKRQS